MDAAGNPTPAAVTDMVRYDPLQNITYGRGGFQTRPLCVLHRTEKDTDHPRQCVGDVSPVPLLDDRHTISSGGHYIYLVECDAVVNEHRAGSKPARCASAHPRLPRS